MLLPILTAAQKFHGYPAEFSFYNAAVLMTDIMSTSRKPGTQVLQFAKPPIRLFIFLMNVTSSGHFLHPSGNTWDLPQLFLSISFSIPDRLVGIFCQIYFQNPVKNSEKHIHNIS